MEKESTFVFVFPAAAEIVSGVEMQKAFQVRAITLNAALLLLAHHCGELGYSDNPDDYAEDIAEGNLAVCCPAIIS